MAKIGSHFSMGPETHRVPLSMHAAARRRLIERLRRRGVPENAVVLLQGGAQQTKYETDRELLFDQESFFQYLFGVKEPGFYGAIQVQTGRATLFMPRLPEAYAVWMGRIHPPEHFQAVYEVDEVHYADELQAALAGMMPDVLLLLHGRNTDSDLTTRPAEFPGIENFKTDLHILHPEIVECRVIKSEEEIELLRWINGVASAAHIEVMRRCTPGITEYQLEAAFLHEIYARGGCRFSAYTSICGCGPHSAVLHYGHQGAPNDGTLRDGDMFLNDSGAQYHGYASDITCSYPVNGRFTAEQRVIYEAVLAANRAVQKTMKPGVLWPDMHRLAERTIAEHLRDAGIVKGTIDELMHHHIPALFMPHGLGHLMGLDVHDVGGYPEGISRINEPGIRSLRCGRKLEAGMVITVEPGIYFINVLLKPALADPKISRFLVPDVLHRFGTFGLRIEDNVLVTTSGSENFTKVPRDIEEIESVMSGAAWESRSPATART
ncbi:MAG TPA: aminopeptidase P family protein [Acidobacteriota bacterium]|nr:aminopeptidase P family protein [Acidobacteriota bacterium]